MYRSNNETRHPPENSPKPQETLGYRNLPMIGRGRVQRICFSPPAITSAEMTKGVFMKEKVAISVGCHILMRNVLLAYHVMKGRMSIVKAAT